jgi:hypothetical protein
VRAQVRIVISYRPSFASAGDLRSIGKMRGGMELRRGRNSCQFGSRCIRKKKTDHGGPEKGTVFSRQDGCSVQREDRPASR